MDKRLLFRWLAPVVLAGACFLPAARAQPAADTPEAEKSERSPPVFQYAVAALFTILVLLIVCMPSRKA